MESNKNCFGFLTNDKLFDLPAIGFEGKEFLAVDGGDCGNELACINDCQGMSPDKENTWGVGLPFSSIESHAVQDLRGQV